MPRDTSRSVQLIPFYRIICYAIYGFGRLSIIPPLFVLGKIKLSDLTIYQEMCYTLLVEGRSLTTS